MRFATATSVIPADLEFPIARTRHAVVQIRSAALWMGALIPQHEAAK